MLRITFGSKRGRNGRMDPSPNIPRVVKSRSKRWLRHVQFLGKFRNYTKF